jgi:hypothetical protein
MTPAPKRRWFQWSLRTLFVVVTVFACWLGYELNSIRQRKQLLKSLQEDSQLSYDPLRTIFVQKGKTTFNGMTLVETNRGDIPWYRRMLGDEGVVCIGLPSKMTEDELRRYQNAFPEAYISQQSDYSIVFPKRPGRHR